MVGGSDFKGRERYFQHSKELDKGLSAERDRKVEVETGKIG